MKNYIYQSFQFKNDIKKYFYAGTGFETHKSSDSLFESYKLATEMAQDKESFMPELVKKIEWLIGEGNLVYDFWEFGDHDFSLYWFIKKEVYLEKMKLIREWIDYEGYQDICAFTVIDPEAYKDEDDISTFKSGLFNDDGSRIDIMNIPIPNLCKSCKKYQSDFWEDNVLCPLNRNDQREDQDFECGAFETLD